MTSTMKQKYLVVSDRSEDFEIEDGAKDIQLQRRIYLGTLYLQEEKGMK